MPLGSPFRSPQSSSASTRGSESPRTEASRRLKSQLKDKQDLRRYLTLYLNSRKREKRPEGPPTPPPRPPSDLDIPSPGLGGFLDITFMLGNDPQCFFPPPPCARSPSLPSIASALDSGCSSPAARLPSNAEDDAFYANLLAEDLPLNPPPLQPDDIPAPEEDDADIPSGPDEAEDEEEAPLQPYLPPVEEDLGRDPDPEPEEPEENEPCAAFREPDELRNFYIRTYLQSAFLGATNNSIREALSAHKDFLISLDQRGILPEEIRAHLSRFPLTLRALQRRLGLEIDEYITTFSLCPKCGMRRVMDLINRLTDPECSRIIGDEECGGLLYTEATLHGKIKKRTPTKSFPLISVAKSIERQLLRPGFLEALQTWRPDGNEEGVVLPVTRRDWLARMNPDAKFGEIWHGWGWLNQPVGLRREFDEETGVYGDRPDGQVVALVRLPLGLSLSVNIDGYVHEHAFKLLLHI